MFIFEIIFAVLAVVAMTIWGTSSWDNRKARMEREEEAEELSDWIRRLDEESRKAENSPKDYLDKNKFLRDKQEDKE